jgi:hypothetical protein
MANGQAARDGILAFENVHVGAADGRGRDAHKSIQRTNLRNWLFIEYDSSRFDKNRRFHFCSHACHSFSETGQPRHSSSFKQTRHQAHQLRVGAFVSLDENQNTL